MQSIFPLSGAQCASLPQFRGRAPQFDLLLAPPNCAITPLLVQSGVSYGSCCCNVVVVTPRKLESLPQRVKGMKAPNNVNMSTVTFLYAEDRVQLLNYLSRIHLLPARDRPTHLIVTHMQHYVTKPPVRDSLSCSVVLCKLLSLLQEAVNFTTKVRNSDNENPCKKPKLDLEHIQPNISPQRIPENNNGETTSHPKESMNHPEQLSPNVKKFEFKRRDQRCHVTPTVDRTVGDDWTPTTPTGYDRDEVTDGESDQDVDVEAYQLYSNLSNLHYSVAHKPDSDEEGEEESSPPCDNKDCRGSVLIGWHCSSEDDVTVPDVTEVTSIGARLNYSVWRVECEDPSEDTKSNISNSQKYSASHYNTYGRPVRVMYSMDHSRVTVDHQ